MRMRLADRLDSVLTFFRLPTYRCWECSHCGAQHPGDGELWLARAQCDCGTGLGRWFVSRRQCYRRVKVAALVLLIGLLSFILAGCSLTPSPAPARFHAVVYCPVDSDSLTCDAGVGVNLASWELEGYARWLSLVAVLGADSVGAGAAWTVNAGTERMPLIALGAGAACPYDTTSGVLTSGCGPVVGVTAGWGRASD